MTTNIEPSTSRHTPLPERWIERLFERMEGYYGARFADQWRGIDPAAMKRCWADELGELTRDEIAAGVAALKTRDWPPTLPEFLKLCRPPTDARADWAEACEQMRVRVAGGADRWSRPQVYWAAVAVGLHDLNGMAWEQIRVRWERALANAGGEAVPEFRAALPAPGSQSVPRDEAKKRVASLHAAVGSTGFAAPGLGWARKLAAQEAAGETVDTIAAQFWREALGVDPQADARAVVDRMREEA